MNDQPDALWLADALELHYAHLTAVPEINRRAAAELRRLHVENERLHQINQSHEMKLSVRGYEIQIEALRLAHAELHALNGELLAALRLIAATDPVDAALDPQRAVRVARAALAKAEGV
jgi:hypothetical protein